MNSGVVSGPNLGRRVGVVLGGATVLLVAVSGISYVLWVVGQRPDNPFGPGFIHVIDRIRWMTDVSVEQNFPTWFNALLWVLLGLAALGAAALSRRRAGWLALWFVAWVASLDESMSLHERLQDLGFEIVWFLGWTMAYAWVVPGILIAALVAVALWPLVRALPPRSRGLLLAGGATFLLGAVGMEAVSGLMVAHFGQITWHVMAVTHLEEALEMLGTILAIVGIVRLFSWRREAPDAGRLQFADPFGAVDVRRSSSSRPRDAVR